MTPTSAFLAPAGDVAGLVAALREALEHRDVSAARAARARIVFEERFAIESWLARVDAVYAEVLAGRARSGASA